MIPLLLLVPVGVAVILTVRSIRCGRGNNVSGSQFLR
jgi:hypothetical protein